MSRLVLNSTRKSALAVAISFLFCVVVFSGCKKTPVDGPNPDAVDEASASDAAQETPQFSIAVRNLSAEKLAALGKKNDLPTEMIFPNSYFVQILRPERLRSLEKGADALEFFENSTLSLPNVGLFDGAELVLAGKTFSLETLKDAKSDAVLQENFPTPAESVYVRSAKPLDQKKLVDAIFHQEDGPNEKVTTQTFGGKEVQVFESSFAVPLDQSGQNIGKIDKLLAGIYFPTPNSVVLLSGSPSAFESFFGALPGDERGIAAQQAGRVSLETLDVAFLYDYDSDVLTTRLVPLPFPTTQELAEAVQKYAASFRFVADATSPDGSLLTLTVDAKSAEGAEELKKTIGGALMQVVDNLAKAPQETDEQKEAAKNLEKLSALLKATNLAVDGEKVLGTLKNTPEALEFLGGVFANMNEFRVKSEQDSKYLAVDQVLFQLGRAFTAYLGKNKTFPAPICAADGTPLLSWRVALLPIFGEEGQKLYDQFKLDEPWNGENNIKLLDKIPSLYVSPLDPNLGTKTPFLVVNSPNAPFGRSPNGLKIQDVANPSRALAVFSADSKNAVEWTRPETFAFNPENSVESFGPVFCGVTLMGEIVRFPVDDQPETAKQIANLVFGTDETAAKATEQPTKVALPEDDETPAPEATVSETDDQTEQPAKVALPEDDETPASEATVSETDDQTEQPAEAALPEDDETPAPEATVSKTDDLKEQQAK